MYAAIREPIIAPSVVAISRDMPIFMFDSPSFMYLLAAPLDVAMVDTRLAPAAYSIGTPSNMVSAGTTTIPPPSPLSEPTSPAATPITSRSAK